MKPSHDVQESLKFWVPTILLFADLYQLQMIKKISCPQTPALSSDWWKKTFIYKTLLFHQWKKQTSMYKTRQHKTSCFDFFYSETRRRHDCQSDIHQSIINAIATVGHVTRDTNSRGLKGPQHRSMKRLSK